MLRCSAAADSNLFCADWAASGECGRNIAYMQRACPYSCAEAKREENGMARVDHDDSMSANAEAAASRVASQAAATECRHELHAAETAKQQCELELATAREAIRDLEGRSLDHQKCQKQLQAMNATRRDLAHRAQQSLEFCDHKLQAAEKAVQKQKRDHQKERELWTAKDGKHSKELARQKELGEEAKQASAKATQACELQLRDTEDTLKDVQRQLQAEVASRERRLYFEALAEEHSNAGRQCEHGDKECLALSSNVKGDFSSEPLQQNISNFSCAVCNCSDRNSIGDSVDGTVLGKSGANAGNRSSVFASLESSDSGLLLEALLLVASTSVSLLRKALLVAMDSKDLGFLDSLPEQVAAEAAAAFTRARRRVCDKGGTLLHEGCMRAPQLLQVVVATTERGLAAIVQAHPELKVWLPAMKGAMTAANGVGPSEEEELRFLSRCVALVIWLLAFVYLVLWRGICVVLIWQLLVGWLCLGPVQLFQLCRRGPSENSARHTYTPRVAAQSQVYV